jgi:cysteinyl-tRNA synthetase
MYVCGLTPQGPSHVGHARTFVVFDLLKRLLTYKGYTVIHIQNFTDIDDKIIQKSKELGLQPSEVAEKYIVEFTESMAKLNVQPPNLYPRVTQHIDDIIRSVKKLLDSGHAYSSGGDVYFDVSSFPEYGKLSHQKVDDLVAGARIEPSEKKRSPEDFALWKGALDDEIGWQSPWGRGRPGWHIECSVMAIKYLGETLDIHGGGQDLIFPHHENEIAQSEVLTGKPFSKYWMHVGLVTFQEEKMSKSTGNVILLADIFKRWQPAAVRLALLSAHYRSPLEWSESILEQAEANVRRIVSAFSALNATVPKNGSGSEELANSVEQAFGRFISSLENDLDTPRALASLFELVRIANKIAEQGGPEELVRKTSNALKDAFTILGLETKEQKSQTLVENLINLLLETREEARKRKDFEMADRIRTELAKLGILVEDTPRGPKWTIVNSH